MNLKAYDSLCSSSRLRIAKQLAMPGTAGNLVAAATNRSFTIHKKWIRPTDISIPEVFAKNVGLKFSAE